jgi:hypothetical protein
MAEHNVLKLWLKRQSTCFALANPSPIKKINKKASILLYYWITELSKGEDNFSKVSLKSIEEGIY